MQTLNITIGRATGETTELPAKEWEKFKISVQSIAMKENFMITVANEGKGNWGEQAETNFHVAAIRSNSLSLKEESRIKRALTILSDTYQQEAIAFSLGSGELLFRREVEG